MRRFAALFDEIDRTTSTNAKVAAMAAYFTSAPAADAAWAVFFLTGRRIKRLADDLDMHEFLDRRCEKFSTGMKQKTSIARTLVHDPAVMIFDETERLIAWSLVYEKSEGQMVAHYYTRRACRRQGFGDRLMKQVQRIAPKPTVVPGEDIMSQRFFSKHQDNLTFGNVYALYGG